MAVWSVTIYIVDVVCALCQPVMCLWTLLASSYIQSSLYMHLFDFYKKYFLFMLIFQDALRKLLRSIAHEFAVYASS